MCILNYVYQEEEEEEEVHEHTIDGTNYIISYIPT